MPESLGWSLYKDPFSPRTSVCFISCPSNTSLQPPAELIFLTRLTEIRRWHLRWKTGRYALLVRSDFMRTELFWQRGTFTTFESLYGLWYFSIYVEYCLTTTWSDCRARGGEIYCLLPLWRAFQHHFGAHWFKSSLSDTYWIFVSYTLLNLAKNT